MEDTLTYETETEMGTDEEPKPWETFGALVLVIAGFAFLAWAMIVRPPTAPPMQPVPAPAPVATGTDCLRQFTYLTQTGDYVGSMNACLGEEDSPEVARAIAIYRARVKGGDALEGAN